MLVENNTCATVSPHLHILLCIRCCPSLRHLHSVLGEKAVCAAVSPHLHIVMHTVLPATKADHSDFGHARSSDCEVISCCAYCVRGKAML